MSSLEEIRREREEKRDALVAKGINPYPATSGRTHRIADAQEGFDMLAGAKTPVILAGRIMSLRRHGGSTFADIFDGTDRMQVFLSRDAVGEEAYDLFGATVDQGDFIETSGTLFVTGRGERTLAATSWRMLTKALQAIPSEFYGIKDEDERYRKRYIDLLLNEQTRDLVEKRAKFWKAVRRFHEDHGFVEVHTPTLEVTTGGGDARPFATHHHALDIDVYLRISAGELWQKRLMVAGFEKTFEVGRIFRNEGMSAEHFQEYEQCEAYWAYADYKQMYEFLRECYRYVAQETFGTQKFSIRGFEIDLAGEWPCIDYTEVIEQNTGVNIWKASVEDIQKKLAELKVDYDKETAGRERLIDTLWKYCRKSIGGPAILINEPKIMSPLAKSKPDNPELTERFHFVIAGSELGQGYSELNDPADQRARFETQQAMRDAGDEEAQMADMEFVEALEYGMPPTAGHGFSERTFAFLMNQPAREVQLFPLMRPRKE
ncbi:lysine--tRNA ligase [Candidatus Kaiserbacteria bacterium]|nr:lysine--tRNA ligase [Candidatus Kaiserbacteria bacterium]